MTGRSDPWFKFFPADWRADPALRMCSGGARALWLEMLCLMHEAEPRGHLLVKGRAPTVRQLAALAGLAEREVGGWMAELEAAEVFSRTDDGTAYSRKMVRDTIKSDQQRGRVEKRWGKDRGTSSGNTGTHTAALTVVHSENVPHIPEARQYLEHLPKQIIKPVVSGQAARGTRLPPDWLPSVDDVAYAAKAGLSPAAILRMADDFRDYWVAKAGKDATKADWPATWRRWTRSEGQKRGGASSVTPKRVGFV